ncbi:SPOR domain-containing protein [Sphingomonas sp. TDK1]|uniref:SPOR domain-containing protein n=1 Tax=Sphingomonas sp. TDK1 TaxID=453247 RepID=UPI0007DA02B3|nr:SPOR domain-containing protein [Sphingomonas sp. TDK1]OAN57145.1 sporulation protein [Sphingomonas sp. TDK1]
MISKKHLGIGAFASALLLGVQPALAQSEVVQAHNPDADALATQMRVLAENPRDIEALLAAARLSTRLGDLSGALALLQRAESIELTNPRIASNRAAVLVRQERPGEALKLFQQAESRGVDPREFAADRGFAYDLLGQPLLAQRDYRLALATKRENDVVRRYALSLGISGNRAEAERELDSLLRAQDRAAWRDRAFILAMNGDVPGAEKIAATVLPGAAGKNLLPFFRRIAALGPADRAFAVHFGALSPTPARLADARMAPSLPAYTGPAPVQIAQAQPVTPAAPPQRIDTQRRRSASTPKPAPVQMARAEVAPVARTVPSQAAPQAMTTAPQPPMSQQPALPQPAPITRSYTPSTPVPQPSPAPRPIVQPTTTPQPEVRRVGAEDSALASIIAHIDVPASERAPATRPVIAAPAPKPVVAAKPVVTVRPKPEPKRASVVEEEDAKPARPVARKGAKVEEEADTKPVKPGTRKGAKAEDEADAKPIKPGARKGAKPADDEDAKPVKGKKPEPKKPDPKKTDPERVWVQVASGANESTVDRAWKGVAAKSPKLLKARGGWWMPFKATNRIVTGPFKTSGEAQAFVNKLAGEGVSAFVVTSEAGQKVTKIAP